MIKPAARIENVRYAIRNIVAEAQKVEATGKRILYLNVGDPLKFDFRTPQHLIEAVTRAMQEGKNGYAPSSGIPEARRAIAQDAEGRGMKGVAPADDVLVTAGASEAIEMALTALLEPGEAVLMPSPTPPLRRRGKQARGRVDFRITWMRSTGGRSTWRNSRRR